MKLTPNNNRPSEISLLWEDISKAVVNWRFWFYLGREDILKQYRRSVIGPIWITLNTAVFIIAFGLLGAQIFKTDVKTYLPYFCLGQIFFNFMSVLLNEGCHAYIAAEAFLKQAPYPRTSFPIRVVWRNLLMLAHNMAVVAGVLIWSDGLGRVLWLDFIGALGLALFTGVFVVAVIAALATRFRDIPMILGSLLQIGFFITPVIWSPEQLTERAQWLVRLNPMAAFLDLLRQPLLGFSGSVEMWLVALTTSASITLIFVVLYCAVRKRIVYWL